MKANRVFSAIAPLLAFAIIFLAACEQPAGNNNNNTSGKDPIPIPKAPGAPELFEDNARLIVVWYKVPGAESYAVYYGPTNDADAETTQQWEGKQTEAPTTASAVITGLENDADYYVWVQAANTSGASGYSGYASKKPTASPVIKRIFFDYGYKLTDRNPIGTGSYTVPVGRTLVLTVVRWGTRDALTYEWKFGGVVQGETGEYFSFHPASTGDYTIHVSATDGTDTYEAQTIVRCTAAEGAYKRAAAADSLAKSPDAFEFMPAPGQFVGQIPYIDFDNYTTAKQILAAAQEKVSNGTTVYDFSLGAFGGYLVLGFDHSVENTGGYDLAIYGNAFGSWDEPGVVWVMQDENGNGKPDDTWYELAGSETGKPATKQRYAITYYRPTSGTSGVWKDNIGDTGVYPRGYPYHDNSAFFTFVGTQLSTSASGLSGYVDCVSIPRYKISDAIQVDGSSVNLHYVDFVKVQNAFSTMSGVLGEYSCETSIAFDLSIPNPDLLMDGSGIGGGNYTYTFNNPTGYDLTVEIAGQTIDLPRADRIKTITLPQATAYFDFYGGNVTYTRSTGLVMFTML
jgi:hypothetical protein